MSNNRQVELDLRTQDHIGTSVMGPAAYVPVLKSRAGELRALSALDSNTKQTITPLIEFTPPLQDDVEAHLVRKADSLISTWGREHRFLADSQYLNDVEVDGGVTASQYLLELMLDRRMRAVPVMVPSNNGAVIEVARRIVAAGAEGCCIRIPLPMNAGPDHANGPIVDLLRASGLNPEQVDLVLDYGSVIGPQRLGYARSIRNVLAGLVHADTWRNLILTATAFPETLKEIPPDGKSSFERSEWQSWSGLTESGPKTARIPTFSDYATAGVTLPHTKYRAALALRYTQDHEWLVFKGRVHANGEPNFAFRRMCAELTSGQGFSGPQASWGDRYLAGYVGGTMPGSSSTVWRQVATSHHLTFVARQLASTRLAAASGQRSA